MLPEFAGDATGETPLMDLFSMAAIFLIFLITIPVMLAVILRVMQTRAYIKARQEREALDAQMQGATLAAATIVSARVTHNSPAGDMLRTRLTLKVEPQDGEAFTTVVEWFVDPVMQTYLQPGSPLSVKIDAKDPRRVYPNLDWAHPAE